MRQFDVLVNPSERSRGIAPYVVVLQSHHLAAMPTVVVAPMLRHEGRVPYSGVGVVVMFADEPLIVSVAELGAIDSRRSGAVVGHLGAAEDELRRAIDRLFTGF